MKSQLSRSISHDRQPDRRKNSGRLVAREQHSIPIKAIELATQLIVEVVTTPDS